MSENFNSNLEKLKDLLNDYYLNSDLYEKNLIYALKLQNNKWWIGQTKNLLRIIEDTKKGKKNKWIQAHPLISIEQLFETGDLIEITIDYMEKYGIENVRGTLWYEGKPEKYIPYKLKQYLAGVKVKDNGEDERESILTDLDKDVVYYVLELENNKWFVGETYNVKKELEKHREGKMSWTKLYKLKDIHEIRREADIRSLTLEYMKEYGWWNVRGFNFRGENWPPEEIMDQFNKYPEDNREAYVVYVLKLEHDKWFIGKTKNLRQKMDDHNKGVPPWIDIHKVVNLEKVIPEGDEKTITLEYMRKYGWENVRGFAWKRWDLQNPPKELIKT